MIRRVVYLLRIFKMFHGLMNNPVVRLRRTKASRLTRAFHFARQCLTNVLSTNCVEPLIVIRQSFCHGGTLKFHYNLTRTADTLHEDRYTFLSYLALFILE